MECWNDRFRIFEQVLIHQNFDAVSPVAASGHVVGRQRSIREWAMRQGWGGRPVRVEQAQGILGRALDVLKAISCLLAPPYRPSYRGARVRVHWLPARVFDAAPQPQSGPDNFALGCRSDREHRHAVVAYVAGGLPRRRNSDTLHLRGFSRFAAAGVVRRARRDQELGSGG